MIALIISHAKKEQEVQSTELTSSELDLFDELEAEHSVAVPDLEVEKDRILGELAVVTSPLKPPVVDPILVDPYPFCSRLVNHSLLFYPELAEFEAMDLDAQLDKLDKLGATSSKAKSKVVDEAVDRVRIWQSWICWLLIIRRPSLLLISWRNILKNSRSSWLD
ncbi:unnamed protein product [Prunus armeniaca]